jgi:hypothetical protein
MDDTDETEAERIALEELLRQFGFAVPDGRPSDSLDPDEYENNQVRDTYAHYGLAMYHAQVVEHEIVNLLVLARIVKARENAEQILSDPWERRFRETLGVLVRRLTPFMTGDQELLRDMTDAVRARNRLAHSYWRERAEDFVSLRGRDDMIAELTRLKDSFINLNRRLEQMSQPFRESLGMTQESIEALYTDMRTRIKERDTGYTFGT